MISSYALLHRDLEMLQEVPWAGVILDEAQNIKNPETKQAKAARALHGEYRIALTGTPVENQSATCGPSWSFSIPASWARRSRSSSNFFHADSGRARRGGRRSA